MHRSQLLAQKFQLFHPLESGFPSPQPTVGGRGHIARRNHSSPLPSCAGSCKTRGLTPPSLPTTGSTIVFVL